MRALILLFFATAFITTAAQADIRVTFDEGAPKDRFTIENVSGCTLDRGEVMIDLSKSAAGLIFDTSGAGAGVEVFQPLDIVRGANFLTNMPNVTDGDNQITLAFDSFKSGDKIAFTIDVDDTIGQTEIIVSGSEINGAAFELKTPSSKDSAMFGPDALAETKKTSCIS